MGKKSRKVIIIISNYNGFINKYKNKPLLYWPLNSLKKTEYQNYKVILADDCSVDNSIKYVKNNFPYVQIVKNMINGGFSKNNNNAIKYAMLKYNPDYIILLNNDIIIKGKKWLGELVKVAESDSKIGLVGCKLIYPNKRIQHAGIKVKTNLPYNIGRSEKDKNQYNSIKNVEGVTFACVLISKKTINKVGLLDENFVMGSEDVDYNIRVEKAGFKILYNGNVELIHLEGYTSTNSKNNKFKEKQFYNEQKNKVYFAYKYYKGFKKIKSLFLIILTSFISIEGKNRKRSLFSIRFKDKIFKRFKLSIKAINDVK
jgi:GT2 family glycosyltransferase